jgi:hypothetical protein
MGKQTSIQITPQIQNKFEKNLGYGYESGSKVGTFDEKNGGGQSRATVPLS